MRNSEEPDQACSCLDGIDIRDPPAAEEGTDEVRPSSFGDTNALYEGLIHSQGLVDRRMIPCLLRKDLESHFLH